MTNVVFLKREHLMFTPDEFFDVIKSGKIKLPVVFEKLANNYYMFKFVYLEGIQYDRFRVHKSDKILIRKNLSDYSILIKSTYLEYLNSGELEIIDDKS